jgi:hypothetical protein
MIAGQVSQLLAASGGKDHVSLVVQPISNGISVRLSVEEGILKAILTMAPTPGSGAPFGGTGPGGKAPPPVKPAGDDPF